MATHYYSTLRDSIGEGFSLEPVEFVRAMGTVDRTPDKRAQPAILPGRVTGPRGNASVEYLSALVLDIDYPSDEVIEALARCKGLVYESYSSSPSNPRFRAVLEIPSPVPRDSWGEYWTHSVKQLKAWGTGAEKCGDPAHVYLLPVHGATVFDLQGEVFRPDLPGVPADLIRRVVKRLRATDRPRDLSIATAIERAAEGLPFAVESERSDTTFQVLLAFKRFAPAASIDSIWRTLEQPLSLMGHGAPTERDVRSAYARIVATSGPALDVVTPFSERAYVLQHSKTYFVATRTERGTRYAPTSREGLAQAVADKLPEIDLAGAKEKEIVQRVGTTIDGIEYSYLLKQCAIEYDGASARLVQPIQPRELTPSYNESIQAWIEALGAAEWCALARDCSLPLAALVIIGEGGCGKSLLAKGLAAIWSDADPPSFEACLGHFNDALLSCPIVFADEDLPRDTRGRIRTADLREFVQRTRHAINAKFRDRCVLRGAARLIVAANRPEQVLAFDGSTLDTEAIQQRLLIRYPKPGLAAWLATQPVAEWIASDAIARHVLAMPDVRRVGRFGLRTPRDLFVWTQGVRGRAVELLAKHILQRRVRLEIRVEGEDVVITLDDLESAWSYYLEAQKPSSGVLASALSSDAGVIRLPLEIIRQWAKRLGTVRAFDKGLSSDHNTGVGLLTN